MYSPKEIQDLKNRSIASVLETKDCLAFLRELNEILDCWQLEDADRGFFIKKYKDIIDRIENSKLFENDNDYLEYKSYLYYLDRKTQRLQTLINSYRLFARNEPILLLIELLVNDNSDKEQVFEYVQIILNNWIDNVYVLRKLRSLLVWRYTFDLSHIDEKDIHEPLEGGIWEISPKIIDWIWDKWYCLDDHTVIDVSSSKWYSNSYVWNLLNDIKYHLNRESIPQLSKIVCDFINWKYIKLTNNRRPFEKIDFILVTPPSKLDRPFQPVLELWVKVAELTQIPLAKGMLIKTRHTPQTKTMKTEESKLALDWAFRIEDTGFFAWKNLLILDDLFWTWTTLNEISKTIKDRTEIGKIFVLTVTRTRTKYWLRVL